MRIKNMQRPRPRTSVNIALILLCSSVVLLLPSGHVFADRPPSGAASILNTVDDTILAGHDNSIVLNSSGHPVISYRDQANDSLNLAVCDDANCDSATVTTVDPDFFNGGATSLKLSSAGFPVIAYVSFFEGLRVAVCDDATCSNPNITPIDASQGVFPVTSLALDSNDFPVISYFDCCPNSLLNLVICGDATCSTFAPFTLDTDADSGGSMSLALNASDAPVVSYHGSGATSVKVAVCGDAACGSVFLETVDNSTELGSSVAVGNNGKTYIAYSLGTALRLAVCQDALCTVLDFSTLDNSGEAGLPSLELDSSGFPVISYWHLDTDELRVAACNDNGCLEPTLTTIDGDLGGYNSLALNHNDEPVISYYEAGLLKSAVCKNCLVPSLETVDSLGNVGQFSSLELNSSGYPVISYYDADNGDLNLAVCDDATCTNPTVTTVDDSPTTMGFYTSLTLNNNDFPVISYWDVSDSALKLAMCNDGTCSSPPIFKTVDGTSASIGTYSSVALNNNGFPVISYYDESNFALRVAVCNNAECSNPSLNTVDGSVDMVGRHTSLVLNGSGFPVISYYDQTNSALKVAVCDNAACSSATPQTVDSSVGFDGVMGTSIALNSNGFPVIGYFDADDDDLQLAVCNDAACTVPELTTVDSAGDVGRYASLRLTDDDYPVISYYDETNDDLKVAVCNDENCNTPTVTRVDSSGHVGAHSSMALNRNGFPVISYYDGTPNADLKVAVMGHPYFFADGFEFGNLGGWTVTVP